MPFEFTCPHCGRRSHVDDRHAGQSGPCAGCGQTITMPAGGDSRADRKAVSNVAGWVMALGGVFAVVAIVAAVAIALLLPSIDRARTAAKRQACSSNLRTLAMAMHNYHHAYGRFPPAFVSDEKGRPMHSWRVLILPFLGEQGLHDAYDFDEPWNGPSNSQLHGAMPSVMKCPADPNQTGGTTNYLMIVGPEAIGREGKSLSLDEMASGAFESLMLIEVANAGVHWMEPRDLPYGHLAGGIQGNGGAAGLVAGSHHPDGCNAAMCDGSVRFLETTTPRDRLKALGNCDPDVDDSGT